MAALLCDITRAAAEPSLVIKWSGEPDSWRWRGRLYDVAAIHAWWEDQAGTEWYRVESTDGAIFLLGRDRDGWVAAPWPSTERKGQGKSPGTSAGAHRFLPVV
ncbi:MAG TPA: hypothetical protein VNT75_01605 [Symbiobacteriaceae bacterium]|nr:hypothetical protein [Symbiobacteriaceae bacterium]